MSLVFNILSRFVIAFLSRSRRLSISCLQSSSIVILEPKKIKLYKQKIIRNNKKHWYSNYSTLILSLLNLLLIPFEVLWSLKKTGRAPVLGSWIQRLAGRSSESWWRTWALRPHSRPSECVSPSSKIPGDSWEAKSEKYWFSIHLSKTLDTPFVKIIILKLSVT